jgi:hypothetical protein
MAAAAASRGGGAPVLPRSREEAEEARLDVAELRAVAISPIEASMRRIGRWPAADGELAGSAPRRGGGAAVGAAGGGAQSTRAGSASGTAFIGRGARGPRRARTPRPAGGGGALAMRPGLAMGLGARAQPVRNRIGFSLLFSNLFLMRKQFSEKSRNCLKPRKILRKSQKFQENY